MKIRKQYNWFLFVLCLALLSGCGRREFSMPSRTMEPTIPAGSHLLVDLWAYGNSDPQRFDIIAFEAPAEHGGLSEGTVLCFRIVGLPNEEIEITDGTVKINNVVVQTPFGPASAPAASYSTISLGPDEYFVLGDNSEVALDSRYWGPVPKENILGEIADIQQPAIGIP